MCSPSPTEPKPQIQGGVSEPMRRIVDESTTPEPMNSAKAQAGALYCAQPATRHILLVDDALDVHLLLTHALRRTRRHDLSLEVCADPREASARIKATPPDLLISDVNMPFIDGPSLITQLRGEGYAGPAVLISNLPCPSHHPHADALLDKAELLANLGVLLERWLPKARHAG